MPAFKLLKNKLSSIWAPSDRNVSLFIYRITLIGFLFTIIALVFGYFQLKTSFDDLRIGYKQLNLQFNELNAKAKIELKIHLSTSTISFDKGIAEPIEIRIIPRNAGNYNTSMWKAVIVFCPSIDIIQYNSDWKKIDARIFAYESRGKILFNQAFFSDEIDSIGNFQIIIPDKDRLGVNQIIPLGIFITYGEKAEPVNTFVYLDVNREISIQYESFLTQDGKVLTDTKGCFVD